MIEEVNEASHYTNMNRHDECPATHVHYLIQLVKFEFSKKWNFYNFEKQNRIISSLKEKVNAKTALNKE